MRSSFLAATALVLTLAACNLKEAPKVGYEAPKELEAEVDSTIYGFCGRASTASVLQLVSMANNDTLMLNVEEARRNGKVLGGYTPGDQVYVVTNQDKTEALLTINEKMLTKEWVEPSAYDGTTPVGVNLKPGGDAESIEQTDVVYVKWSIMNGLLQLVETRDDGTGVQTIQSYTIRRLTEDSLYIFNNEESFEFGVLSKYADQTSEGYYDDEEDNDEEDFLRAFD